MLKTQYSVYADEGKPESILTDVIDIERIG